MRVIIAGSRDIEDYQAVLKAVTESGFDIKTVVSGGCRGVDTLGERWAEENCIPVEVYLPDWLRYGKAAGPLRNKKMAESASGLILVMRPEGSSGSKNMLKTAQDRRLRIFQHLVP